MWDQEQAGQMEGSVANNERLHSRLLEQQSSEAKAGFKCLLAAAGISFYSAC